MNKSQFLSRNILLPDPEAQEIRWIDSQDSMDKCKRIEGYRVNT